MNIEKKVATLARSIVRVKHLNVSTDTGEATIHVLQLSLLMCMPSINVEA